MKNSSRTIKIMLYLFAGFMMVLTMAILRSEPAASQAETFTQVERYPVEFVVDEPCLGEQVDVSGYLQEVIHVTVDEQGSFHLQYISSAPNLTGTGLSSGGTYRAVGTAAFSQNLILDRGATVTGIDNSTLVGPEGNNLYIRFRFHVTRNANDELIVVREIESVTCR